MASLKSRIIVAAGGGGADTCAGGEAFCKGGEGGGLHGGNSGTSGNAAGATQITGGTGLGNGAFGIGGTAGTATGAGGGGYWGGGSSSDATDFGGSGGSSYISGHAGSVAIASADSLNPRKDSKGTACADGTTDIVCSYHYSGYKFTNTKMIDGAGYNWTTVKGNYVGQPQPDGSTAAGHSGNGYARITYLGSTL